MSRPRSWPPVPPPGGASVQDLPAGGGPGAAGRVLIALGGNAMTAPDGRAGPQDQIAALGRAARRIAEVVATGVEVLATHGNGPQVGNILVKNELAATVVPPVPLDWCGAQTQGTIGFVLCNALERTLAGRRPVAALVTRTLVDAADPGFQAPTKPIGRYLPADEAKVMIEHGQVWRDRGARGWRRVVASPEPVEVLDAPAVGTLLAAGYLVIAAGGGGIPVVREPDGTLRDVEAAQLGWGTAHARPLGVVRVDELRRHAAAGEFASGDMGPKVEAACRFVEAGGECAVITSLDRIADGVAGRAGTVVSERCACPNPSRC